MITKANISEKKSIKANLEQWCFESECEWGKISGRHAKMFIKHRPKGTIVDLGAGDCVSANIFAKTNPTIAVDINQEKLDRAAEAVQKECTDYLTYLKKHKDNSIDNFYSHHSLEHFVNPEKVLKQMYRTLNPGGLAYIVVPCEQATHEVHHATFSTPEDLIPKGAIIIEKDKGEMIRVLWSKHA